MIYVHENIYNIPDVTLYSKKQILDMLNESTSTMQSEKYYCTFDSKWYNAILHEDKLFAKQYPGKDLWYITSDVKSDRK